MIYPPLYEELTLDELFSDYLREIEAAVRTGWFCSIGHLDIPKRYLPRKYRKYEPANIRDRLQPVFRAMIESQGGIRDQHVGDPSGAEDEYARTGHRALVRRCRRKPESRPGPTRIPSERSVRGSR